MLRGIDKAKHRLRDRDSKIRDSDIGMTLLEILLALVIIGIIVSIVLTIYISQYRLNIKVAASSEGDYSLLRAGQVITLAVMTGEKVEWTGDQLFVTYCQEDELVKDSYYLADKDRNGVMDLYREHLSVPNPVATGLIVFECREINQGLWLIKMEAKSSVYASRWERKVRQRVCLN